MNKWHILCMNSQSPIQLPSMSTYHFWNGVVQALLQKCYATTNPKQFLCTTNYVRSKPFITTSNSPDLELRAFRAVKDFHGWTPTCPNRIQWFHPPVMRPRQGEFLVNILPFRYCMTAHTRLLRTPCSKFRLAGSKMACATVPLRDQLDIPCMLAQRAYLI